MDFIIVMLPPSVGLSTCGLDNFSITLLGWPRPLMDIMIFWSSIGMNPSTYRLVFFRFITYDELVHLWTYNFNSSLGMSPSTNGLVLFRFIPYDEPIHLRTYNFNSSFGMNPSTYELDFWSPFGINSFTYRPNNFQLTPWWTHPLRDFNKL